MIAAPSRLPSLVSISTTKTADVQGFRRYVQTRADAEQDGSNGQLARLVVQRSQLKLRLLRLLSDNWDGAYSARPRAGAIANASARLPELYRTGVQHAEWREPHISASETGDISFEWWCGPRKVTMYFGDESVELIKVWGEDIDHEMAQAAVSPRLNEFAEAWVWLYGY